MAVRQQCCLENLGQIVSENLWHVSPFPQRPPICKSQTRGVLVILYPLYSLYEERVRRVGRERCRYLEGVLGSFFSLSYALGSRAPCSTSGKDYMVKCDGMHVGPNDAASYPHSTKTMVA